MPNVKIVTDSLADIPPKISQDLAITTVPCIVRFGDTEFRDRIDLYPPEFYRLLTSSPTLPATSQPATGVFEDIYRKLAQQTDQIMAIHTIASLSGIYNASRVAAQNIPNVQIELIDSKQVSMSLGWLVILAARAAQAGANLAEIRDIVQDAMKRVHIIAMLNTLEYAKKGGRLGKGAALVGTLLNVKPLLSCVNGEIVPVENVRTQKRALERLVEIVLGSGPIQELSVMHAAAEDLAKDLKETLSSTFPAEHILLSETGPVLGTHVGPGAVGIAWLTGKY